MTVSSSHNDADVAYVGSEHAAVAGGEHQAAHEVVDHHQGPTDQVLRLRPDGVDQFGLVGTGSGSSVGKVVGAVRRP